MIDCARCQWRPDPGSDAPVREQAQVHAADLDHPRCVVCGRSLVRGELGTCETRDPGDGTPCLQTAREHVSGIRSLYDDLGSHVGHLRGPRLGSSSPNASDGRPLPGGDVLALLGPGSDGGAARPLTVTERQQRERWWVTGAAGPLTQAGSMAAERERTGREHMIDNRPADGLSVHGMMTSWESDWRTTFNDPSRDFAGSTEHQTRRAIGYIETHMRRASREHSEFAEFADELRNLHRTLERASALIRTPARPESACFDCGGQLIVGLVEATVAQVVTPHQWWLPGRIGPLPAPSPASWTGLVEQDPPHITCERCHRGYTPAAYALARRQLLERERDRERERQAAQAASEASG